jgi:MFS family permease
MEESDIINDDEVHRSRSRSSPSWYIFLIVFIDLFAVGLVIPLIPLMMSYTRIGKIYHGIIGMLYGCTQMITDPFIGYLSDCYGRKSLFIISSLSACVSYLLIGISNHIILIALSRMIVGTFKHTLTIASAIISDQTSHETRSGYLSALKIASATGYIFGPIIGGYISHISHARVSIIIGSLILFINGIIIHYSPFTTQSWIDQDPYTNRMSHMIQCIKNHLIDTWMKTRVFQISVGSILIVRFILNLTKQIMVYAIIYFVHDYYKYGSVEIGIIVGILSTVSLLSYGSFMFPLCKWISDANALIVCYFTIGCMYMILAYIDYFGFYIFMVCMVVIISCENVCGVILLNMYTKYIDKNNDMSMGLSIGVFNWVSSFARVMGPFVSSIVYVNFGYQVLFIMNSMIIIILVVYTWVITRGSSSKV